MAIVGRKEIGGDNAAASVAKTAGGEVAVPLVTVVDQSGTAVTPATGVVEDAAAAANPTGVQLMARYRAAPATEGIAAGDHVALNANINGELYVTDITGLVQTTISATQTTAAATSLAVIDDWDESDRAKVNLIASQAGVAGGQGAIGANTLRTVPAALEYEAVAAADTDEPIGTAGDYVSHVVFCPAATNAGASNIKDGSTTLFSYTAGTLADLKPIIVPLGVIAVTGITVTTGTNMTATAYGNFA